MKRQELIYSYPEELVGTSPQYPPRVLWNAAVAGQAAAGATEISWPELLDKFKPGDILVLNDTQVLKRRIFSEEGLEILFLSPCNPPNMTDVSEFRETSTRQTISMAASEYWEVLFPSKKLSLGDSLSLPLGLKAKLVQKGRPQVLKLTERLSESYFEKVGELPIPPYIQKARSLRHNQAEDQKNYQTIWANKPGSLAAPTASLHFKSQDLAALKSRGVQILTITLHVGLGTFLPVTAEDLKDHQMHSEYVEIAFAAWEQIKQAKKQGARVWSLGTTVARSLESQALGYFKQTTAMAPQTVSPGAGSPPQAVNSELPWCGTTDLLIQPGFEFKIVDNLLTNFHQPESTLLALVAAFAGLENVKKSYAIAIEKRMRLFSYGDLSVWSR